jgi:N-glycosidase YbiA
MINSFDGEYRFLSNFWPCRILYEGIEYASTEHAFQAAKTLDVDMRQDITKLRTASEAKMWGKVIPLRPDWEQVKIDVMETLLRIKFRKGTSLFHKLLATGDQELVEGNYWHDEFWGVCSCPKHGQGLNWLGHLLMKIRDENYS